MPTVVIAPDSFKESMSAIEAAQAMRAGVLDTWPQAHCVLLPMSDGGEGFVATIAPAWNATLVTVEALDALGRSICATYGRAQARAVLDAASVIGLELIEAEQRNVAASNSRGLGIVIRHALDAGVRDFVIGIGGTATTDAGVGMLTELGVRLVDSDGVRVDPYPLELDRVRTVDMTGLDQRILRSRIRVACDVTNPLVGPTGAAAIFGPQKGVADADIAVFDAALASFANATGCGHLADTPGAGAAGGLGFAFHALLGAELTSGVHLVADAIGLDKAIAGADLVLSGEGAVDAQTLDGKTLSGIAALAQRYRVPLIVFAGKVSDDLAEIEGGGVHDVVCITPPEQVRAEALASGTTNLRRAVAARLAMGVGPESAFHDVDGKTTC
ncbi:glycerate kinase [Schaalia suimastitidis]|uniref:glycerate kinase n=1 Tax=Schaalia suimastitidis TaxID=121163 RepID=UPI00040512FD|nr:glycerate kinase [Schaalia suimastitidis]